MTLLAVFDIYRYICASLSLSLSYIDCCAKLSRTERSTAGSSFCYRNEAGSEWRHQKSNLFKSSSSFSSCICLPFFFFIAHWNKKGLVRETSGDEGGEVKPWLGATDGPADY